MPFNLFGKSETNSEMEKLINFQKHSQPLESKIEEIRHDHKNVMATIGEALDNSIDWGKATNIVIDIKGKNILKIIDDGIGISSVSRMNEILLLGNKNDILTTQKELTNVIGKFGST